MDIIKKIIDNPRVILIKFVKLLSPIIPNDKTYLGLRYWSVFGKSIDWLNPISYNEKLQWLKVYDRNPIYTTLVDKYLVKEYISNKYGGGI